MKSGHSGTQERPPLEATDTEAEARVTSIEATEPPDAGEASPEEGEASAPATAEVSDGGASEPTSGQDAESAQSRPPRAATATTRPDGYIPARRLRRRPHGHRTRDSRVRLLKLAIIFGGVVFFLTVLFMSGYIASVAGENHTLGAELNRSQRQVAELESRLHEVRSQRDMLVQDRIPNLQALEYDKAIPLQHDYVRNVIFTLAREGEETRHEYRIVLHNETLSVVHPQVKIVLFDDVGVQIGLAQVEKADASTPTDRTLLDPGEVRSYSGTVSMLNTNPPKYFLVTVE